jgi:hypothetical protein
MRSSTTVEDNSHVCAHEVVVTLANHFTLIGLLVGLVTAIRLFRLSPSSSIDMALECPRRLLL